MNQTYIKFKEDLLNTGIFRHRNSFEYSCQCPYCGDNKGHCYVKIDTTDDSPVVFKCFKCVESGIFGNKFIEFFNLDLKIPKNKCGNKKIIKKGGVSVVVIDDILKESDHTEKVCNYILGRVGHYPSFDELKMFQYVGNPIQYTREYLGGCDNNRIFNNRFWFKLTNGNIAGRWKNDETDFRWMRMKSNNVCGKGLYSMKKGFNPNEELNICIAEGVLDVIGLYYNYSVENSIYIATMGKDYESGLDYVIDKGLYGKSVNVKIFKDPDVEFIKLDKLKQKLFNRIEIYGNILGYDYGVKPDKLEIRKLIMKKQYGNIY